MGGADLKSTELLAGQYEKEQFLCCQSVSLQEAVPGESTFVAKELGDKGCWWHAQFCSRFILSVTRIESSNGNFP